MNMKNFKEKSFSLNHFSLVIVVSILYDIYGPTKEMSCSFLNIEILLKIFLTISLSNASGERSFSVLKRVTSYLRNIIGEGLNKTGPFCTKNILNSIDTAKINDDFARYKARRNIM